jgi:hypothetical protein
LSHEAQRGQLSGDGAGVSTKQPWDVLQEDVAGSNQPNNVPRCRPHVLFVIGATFCACARERLAGKACANHVRNSSVLLGRTGLCELTHVSEDRGALKVAVCDALGDDSLAVVVPFDIADVPPPEQLGAEQSAACAAEKREFTHTPSVSSPYTAA